MIDTVVINLYNHQFEILPEYYKRFSPSVENFFHPPYVKFGHNMMARAICNPTAEDKATHIYYPRLTLQKAVRVGGIITFLRVEFSAPKILFGNNFDELTEKDFDDLCEAVVIRLAHFGVIVNNPNIIAEADVSAIHYSKNIPLTDYSSPSTIITEISKADVNGLQDINSSDFRNSGQAFKVHNNGFEFIIYDKIKDLKRSKISEKRSISRDNYSQISLFEDVEWRKPFEVIRLEARYGNKIKIKGLLKGLGLIVPSEMTLRKLYSDKIAQMTLKHELAKIKVNIPLVLRYQSNEMVGIYNDLVVNNPNKKLADIMSAMGYRALLKETGSRDIKTMAGKTSQEWYRFKKKISDLKFTGKKQSCFDVIDKGLEEFKPVELKSFIKD